MVRADYELPDRARHPPAAVAGHEPHRSHGQVPANDDQRHDGRDDVQSRQRPVDDEGAAGSARTRERAGEGGRVDDVFHGTLPATAQEHHGFLGR